MTIFGTLLSFFFLLEKVSGRIDYCVNLSDAVFSCKSGCRKLNLFYFFRVRFCTRCVVESPIHVRAVAEVVGRPDGQVCEGRKKKTGLGG